MSKIYKKDHHKQRTVKWVVNSNGCYICTSHKTDDSGYACGQRKGKHVKLHRYFYELRYGKLPDDIVLLHSCDTRNCLRLSHLKPDSHQANMDDMVNKGRQAKGERVASSKLTQLQVDNIRTSVCTTKELAEKYGVHQSTIRRARNGTYWS